MASTDARPIPQKNVAYRVTFPILDADGDLVTSSGLTLDSEISKDGGTFTDCTSEATEINTTSGMYFLDLTSTEMNADCVAIIVKTGVATAKTVPIVLYPEETGDIRTNVTAWSSTAVATPDTAGYPKVTNKAGTGTGELNLTSGDIGITSTAVSNIWAFVIENSRTALQVMRVMFSAMSGKASGLGTTTAVYRDNADGLDRITATVDASGNRSAVTLNLT